MAGLVFRRPPTADLVLAGFYVVVVVAEAVSDPAVGVRWMHAALGVAAMALLAFRRQHPLVIAAAVVLVVAVLARNGGALSLVFAILVMTFTLGSELEGRASWVGLALVVAPTLLALAVEAGRLVPGDLGAVATFAVAPWVAGRTVRHRTEQLADARAHATRIELGHQLALERAATEERIRLARELHDVVSHSISVIAIQAQAVRRRLRPDQTRETQDLAAVEAAAREAMAEMRRLFGVLRDQQEDTSLEPQPGLAQLERLLGQVESTGMHVDLTTEGKPCALSPGLDLAAYRIVQEAVTNAIRHSGGEHVGVRLRYHLDELEVLVTDDGFGIAALNGHVGEGHGLRGIRERAELYGGRLEVRPDGDRGTRVHAHLPLGAGR